jgi:hypothetical protein
MFPASNQLSMPITIISRLELKKTFEYNIGRRTHASYCYSMANVQENKENASKEQKYTMLKYNTPMRLIFTEE